MDFSPSVMHGVGLCARRERPPQECPSVRRPLVSLLWTSTCWQWCVYVLTLFG